jgi:NAD(P)-dependent dehydrogenase (short-subunit alcohol dehydrogenase family)
MHIAITGVSKGIGASVLSRLKDKGHQITAFDVLDSEENIEKFIKVDLSDLNSISNAIEKAEGPFDALVNNAGLPPRVGLEEKILLVNYIGMKAFLDGMLDKLAPGASIVSTASRAGALWQENIDQVKRFMKLKEQDLKNFIMKEEIDPVRAYNLSKEAMIAMTIARTEELNAREFRINSVCPAAVSTEILKDFTSAFGEKVVKNIARVGRPASPGEVADLIVFLTSPNSFWIKGQNITIDGGMSAMIMTDMLNLQE